MRKFKLGFIIFFGILQIYAQPPIDSTTMPSTTSSEQCSTWTDSTTTPEPANICDGNIGKIIADLENCSRYIFCTKTGPALFYCPINYIFRDGQNRCVIGKAKACQATPWNELCSNTFFGAYPHPDEPNEFVACINGAAFVTSCERGKFFEAILARCVKVT